MSRRRMQAPADVALGIAGANRIALAGAPAPGGHSAVSQLGAARRARGASRRTAAASASFDAVVTAARPPARSAPAAGDGRRILRAGPAASVLRYTELIHPLACRVGPLALAALWALGTAVGAAGQPSTAAGPDAAAAPALVTASPARSAAAATAPGGSSPASAPQAKEAAASANAVCDSTSTLNLLGMDTASGVMLFATGGPSDAEAGWLIELDAAAHEARAFRGLAAAHFGGSIGPGPVVALAHCGPDCLQVERWSSSDGAPGHGAAGSAASGSSTSGSGPSASGPSASGPSGSGPSGSGPSGSGAPGSGVWEPLGDRLMLPASSTVAATYDEGGNPWIVAHATAALAGHYQAWSFRYEDRQWKAHGGLTVTAVGQPQVLPAPQRRDGVVSGTGLFAASGAPETWVRGLPGVAAARRGQLLALDGDSVAYITADGVAYLSADAGKTWRRSTWTPWGDDTTGMWRQGSDYGIDLPLGDHRGALQLVWFDRRSQAREQVVLTRLGADGKWLELGHAPVDVTTASGEHLPVTQVLVPRRDDWILLSGCAMTSGGAGLVLRSFDQGHLSDARFVPIRLRSE